VVRLQAYLESQRKVPHKNLLATFDWPKMVGDGNVPFSSQWSFVLGEDVAAESWGIHPNKNDVYASKWSSADFHVDTFIGQGGFGRVVRARFRRGKMSPLVGKRDVALKIISKAVVMDREKRGRRALLLLRRETNIQSQYVCTAFSFWCRNKLTVMVLFVAYITRTLCACTASSRVQRVLT
jgi:serine/threonine protein kinase